MIKRTFYLVVTFCCISAAISYTTREYHLKPMEVRVLFVMF